MKTNELTGAALDWAVCKASGTVDIDMVWGLVKKGEVSYSTDWRYGGPIIERERLQLSPGYAHDEHRWSAVRYDHLFDDDLDCFMGGNTPLIAAMRCYVASKLGAEVEIPEELTHG